MRPAKIEKCFGSESATTSAVGGGDKAKGRGQPHVRRARGGGARDRFFQPLPLGVWAVALTLAVVGLFSANPWLSFVSILLLPVFGSLLWLPGEPPVLLFACVMQWNQASIAIFYANAYGLRLSQESDLGGVELVQATWLSMLGVLALALGIRLALQHRAGGVALQVAEESQRLMPGKIFGLYIGTSVVFYFLERVALVVPALRQPLLAITSLQWVLLFLLFHSVMTQQGNYRLLAASVIIQMAVGVLGFFGGFKDVIFVLLVALTSSRVLFRSWRLAAGVSVVVALVGLSIIWTTIKSEYREFLNQGTGQQVVYEPVKARFLKLAELIGNIDDTKIQTGLEQTILRLSYVKFFALTIANVPSEVPYENGALWIGAMKHVLMPRFLFPNKPALDDSAQTKHYTGLNVAGQEEGTSIGLGYLAQSYIDFGKWGMFVPVFLLGVFYGSIYRYFSSSKYKVLGLAMATAILVFSAYKLEASNTKLVGGNLMGLLVMGLFVKVAGPWFWNQISRQGTPRSSRRPKRRSSEP